MTTIVVAMGENREIGKGNRLLWHLPKDLRHFREVTNGHPVIMGRKTYESIGKALPNRTNIIISRKKDWFEEGVLIVGSIKEALKFAKRIDEEVFIIGGASIYEQTLDIADRLEVTRVKATFEADAYFPEISDATWRKTAEEWHNKDKEHSFEFCFQTFEKIPKKIDLID